MRYSDASSVKANLSDDGVVDTLESVGATSVAHTSVRLAANYGLSPEFEEFARSNPIRPGRGTITGRVALEAKPVHIPGVLVDPEYTATEYRRCRGYRSNLAVPLLREGVPIGVFVLTRPVVNSIHTAKIKPQAEHRTGQTRLHPRPRRRRARTALPPSRVTPQRRPASSDRCDVAF
jgi:hypothetical protein